MSAHKIVTIHQPQYLPYLGLMAKIHAADSYIFFDTADYQKGYFDNRNRVMTKSGLVWLTIPVNSSLKEPIAETRIAGRHWKKKHLRTLEQAYGKAQHFRTYFEEFSEIITGCDSGRLSDMAEATLKWLLRGFGISTEFLRASDLETREVKVSVCERLKRLTIAAGGDAYLAGPSWGNYMTFADASDFRQDGFSFLEAGIRTVEYQGHNGFFPNLSAIDLLFSQGADGLSVINSMISISEVSYEKKVACY